MKTLLLDSEAGPGRAHARIPLVELVAKGVSHFTNGPAVPESMIHTCDIAIVHQGDDRHATYGAKLAEAGVPVVVISNDLSVATERAAVLRRRFPSGRIVARRASEIGDVLLQALEVGSVDLILGPGPLERVLDALTALWAIQLEWEHTGRRPVLRDVPDCVESLSQMVKAGVLPSEGSSDLLRGDFDAFLKRFDCPTPASFQDALAHLRDDLLRVVDDTE
jgi:hypothetical protein